MKTVHKCCICGVAFHGYGNNPHPFPSAEDRRACDTCNDYFVVPARLRSVDAASMEFLSKLARFLAEEDRCDVGAVADFLALGSGLAELRKDISERRAAKDGAGT